METLSSSDIIALNNVISDLYSIREADNFHRRAMSVIKKLVAFDRSSYNKFGTNRSVEVLINRTETEQIGTDKLKDAFNAYINEHPFFTFNLDESTLLEITDKCHFRKTSLYNEYYRNLGIDSQIIYGLSSSGDNSEVYSLTRGPKSFSDKEKLLLALLKPHVVGAFRNACERTKFMGEVALLEKIAGENEKGVVLLSSDGKIRSVNRRARCWLREYFVISPFNPDELPYKLREWVVKEINSPEALMERNKLIVNPLNNDTYDKGKHLTIRFVSSCDSQSSQYDKYDISGYMLIIKEERPSAIDHYGLTPREKEILHWVSMGKSNREINIILGVSQRTVEKHLEHIFDKMGVETRVAAVALATDKI